MEIASAIPECSIKSLFWLVKSPRTQKQAEIGKKRDQFCWDAIDLNCRLCIYASPMGIWEFYFFNFIGGGTIIFEVFVFLNRLAVFFPFTSFLVKLSINCNSIFSLFFGVGN